MKLYSFKEIIFIHFRLKDEEIYVEGSGRVPDYKVWNILSLRRGVEDLRKKFPEKPLQPKKITCTTG